MRLATIATQDGLRLHVRGRSGYVDVAEATGDPRFASLHHVLEAGLAGPGCDPAPRRRRRREVADADFGPAVPSPPRILCLGLNYSEHALEGGREVPTWPDAFVRGADSVLGPYADLVKPALTDRFDYEAELGIVIGAGGRYITADKALDAIAGFVVLNDALGARLAAGRQPVDAGQELRRQHAHRPRGGHHRRAGRLRPGHQLHAERPGHAVGPDLADARRRAQRRRVLLLVHPAAFPATSSPPAPRAASASPARPRCGCTPGTSSRSPSKGVGTIRNRVVAEEDAPQDWRWRPGTPLKSGF